MNGMLLIATSRSLILIDELGRGTSVGEGIAIATNVLDHIHSQIRCRTLFATHYRPVTELARGSNHMKNYKMCAIPTPSSLLLSYKLEPGVSDQSYGLYVARMAGIPEQIIQKCEDSLKKKQGGKEKQICDILRNLKVEEMTPLQCMMCMAEVKEALQSQKVEDEKIALERLAEHYTK